MKSDLAKKIADWREENIQDIVRDVQTNGQSNINIYMLNLYYVSVFYVLFWVSILCFIISVKHFVSLFFAV